ncbi:MAG: DUF448 domain-containing protein [Deltaproteobacteria bacterium]|nr:DUF448 domain-containing protein [Deltaproteobacteria bacterium]
MAVAEAIGRDDLGRRSPTKGMRSCAGCGARVPLGRARRELVRLVVPLAVPGRGGDVPPVLVDLAGRAVGRGVWVHAAAACVDAAAVKGIARSLHAPVRMAPAELRAAFGAAAGRRVAALLGAAARSGQLAVGATASLKACSRGHARLLIAAHDAAAAVQAAEVRAAAERGLVVRWACKGELGAAVRGAGAQVGLVAVLSVPLAEALRAAIALFETFARAGGAAPGPPAVCTAITHGEGRPGR